MHIFASNDGWKTQTELVYEDNFWGGNENWTNAGTVEYGRHVFQTKYICESDDECVGSDVCLSDQYTDTSDFRHISLILY